MFITYSRKKREENICGVLQATGSLEEIALEIGPQMPNYSAARLQMKRFFELRGGKKL